MKKCIHIALVLLGVLIGSDVFAQNVPGTLTQQSPTRLDAVTNCSTGTGAASAAVTVTVIPPGGQFVYVTYLDVTNYVSAAETGNAAPNLITITGIQGAPVVSMATAGATVGSVADRYLAYFTIPIKGVTAGTNYVITTPAVTGALWRVNTCYYFAP